MRPSSVVRLYESRKQRLGTGSLERQRGKSLPKRLHRHLDKNTALRRRCHLQIRPVETFVPLGTNRCCNKDQNHRQAAQMGARRLAGPSGGSPGIQGAVGLGVLSGGRKGPF